MEEEVLDKYKVEESNKEAFQRWRCSLRNGGGSEIQNKKVGEKTVGQEFSPCLKSTICSVSKASRMSERKRKR